jgi:hypothetical protein
MPVETQQTAAKILEEMKEIIEQELQVIAMTSGRHLTIAPRSEFEHALGHSGVHSIMHARMLLIAWKSAINQL